MGSVEGQNHIVGEATHEGPPGHQQPVDLSIRGCVQFRDIVAIRIQPAIEHIPPIAKRSESQEVGELLQ